ncbi:MAG: S8 family serine peptidase [Eubacterium sp.]|nr:S8 family serine peptidase [Eubacterium sp.]
MKKKILALLLCVTLLIGFIPLAIGALHRAKEISAKEFISEYETLHSEYKDSPVSELIMVKSAYEVPKLDSVASAEGYADLHFMQFDNTSSAEKALTYYQQLPTVEYAEADSRVYTAESNNYSSYSSVSSTASSSTSHLSWGGEVIGVDEFVEKLGDTADSLPTVTVGIVDSGIDTGHSFLKRRIISTGVNYSSSGEKNSEYDDNGHGTHVAGIVVDNTTDNVKIRGYKCLNKNGYGDESAVCAALIKAVDDGVNVINLSLGRKDEQEDETLRYLIEDAIDQGVTVCIAAGNDAMDAAGYYPANVEAAITVGAVNMTEELCKFSNYGNSVDLLAPGSLIESCWPNNQYLFLQGTSMAAPFASAASAMVLGVHPDYTCDDICRLLMRCGRDIGNSKIPRGRLINISATDSESAEPPIISTHSGSYVDEVRLTMTCPTENADIYYTIYGYKHTEYGDNRYRIVSDVKYDGGEVVINQTAFVKAYSKSANGAKGGIATAYYYVTHTDNEQFEIDENGIITAYHGNQPYLAVPDELDGVAVRGIGNDVFAQTFATHGGDDDFLIYISLPDTCTYIGENAFLYNSNLQKVIADNLQIVDKNAFAYANNLAEIDMTSLTSLGEYAFAKVPVGSIYNKHLTELPRNVFDTASIFEVYLPNVTQLGDYAFYHAVGLKAADFPKVTYIGRGAFREVNSLSYVNMPQLQEFAPGGYQFKDCPITTDSLNIGDFSGTLPQNVFYGTQLQCFDNENVTQIDQYAFGETPLEYVKLKAAQQVNYSAFYNCSQLKTAYLPSVEILQANVFNKTDLQTLFAPQLQELDVTSLHTDAHNAATSAGNPVNIYCMGGLSTVNNISRFKDDVVATFAYTFITPSGSSTEQICSEKGWSKIDSDTMADTVGTHNNNSGETVFEFGWKSIEEIEQYADSLMFGFGDVYDSDIFVAKNGNTYFGVASNEDTARCCVNVDGMIFRSASLTIGENETEPENGCTHDWQPVYSVPIQNDSIIVLKCANCNEYYRVSFAAYINDNYAPVDLNGDGIVNGRDYAILKSYNAS